MTVSSKFYVFLMFWSSNHWRDIFIDAYSSNGILLVVETVSRNAFPVGKFLEYAEAPSETTNKWLKRSLSLKIRDNSTLVTDPTLQVLSQYNTITLYICIHLATESCFWCLHMFLFLNDSSHLETLRGMFQAFPLSTDKFQRRTKAWILTKSPGRVETQTWHLPTGVGFCLQQ